MVRAFVLGGTTHERLVLNKASRWTVGPYNADSPETLAALPESGATGLARVGRCFSTTG